MKAAPVRETCSSSSQYIHVFWAACTQWSCLCCLCEGECLVVGQSHFKTFDNKFFTFTGHCLYLLAKDCKDGRFSVIIENVQVMSMCFELPHISPSSSFTLLPLIAHHFLAIY